MIPATPRLTAHDLGWGQSTLSPEEVTFALGHGRDPDADHADGPVETMLSLSDPVRATACEAVLHAWRLAQGREEAAQQARLLWAARLIRVGRVDLLRAWGPDFMDTQCPPLRRGPLSLFLDRCAIVNTAEGRSVCKVLTQRLTQGLRTHRGIHGVPEAWEVLGWLGAAQANTGRSIHFQSPQTKKSIEKAVKDHLGPIFPGRLPEDLILLAKSLAHSWEAHLRSGAPVQSPDNLMRISGWMHAWLHLATGVDVLGDIEIATALYEKVPSLAHGFGCLRQGVMGPGAVQMHLDSVALLDHAHGDPVARDAFAWAALPLPRQGSNGKQRAELSDKWCDLVQRHPQWVLDRPIPIEMEQKHLFHDPRLLALWRNARHQDTPLESISRRRARP